MVFSRRVGKQRRRSVQLRPERNDEDWRFLSAHNDDDGSLVISGQDPGPATAVMSSDGERRYTGQSSYDLEAIICGTEATIPRQFWSWSG